MKAKLFGRRTSKSENGIRTNKGKMPLFDKRRRTTQTMDDGSYTVDSRTRRGEPIESDPELNDARARPPRSIARTAFAGRSLRFSGGLSTGVTRRRPSWRRARSGATVGGFTAAGRTLGGATRMSIVMDAFATPEGYEVVTRGWVWGYLAVTSAGCLGCLSMPGDRSGTDDLVGTAWCVAASVVLMLLGGCLAVGMRYGPSRRWLTVVGKGNVLPVTRETTLCLLASVLQMSTAAVVFDPESGLGVTEGGTLWNASLFLFSWASSCAVSWLAVDVVTAEDKSGLLPVDRVPVSNRTGRLFGLTFVAGAALLSFSLAVQMDCADLNGDVARECRLTNIGSVSGIVGMFVPTLYVGLNVLASVDRRRQERDLFDPRTVRPSTTLLASASFVTACVNAAFLTNSVDEYGGVHANLYAVSWTYLAVALALLLGQVDQHLLPDYPSYYDESYEAELAAWKSAGQRWRRRKRRSRSRSNDSTAPMSEMSRSVYSEADHDLESYEMSRAGVIDGHLSDFFGNRAGAGGAGGLLPGGASSRGDGDSMGLTSHVFTAGDGIGAASVVSSMDDTTSYVFSTRPNPGVMRPTREPSGLLGLPAPPPNRNHPPESDRDPMGNTPMPRADDSYYGRPYQRDKTEYTEGNSTLTGRVQTVDSSDDGSDDGSAERINAMPLGQMRRAAPPRPRMVQPKETSPDPEPTFADGGGGGGQGRRESWLEPVDFHSEPSSRGKGKMTMAMAMAQVREDVTLSTNSTRSKRSRRSRSGSSEKSRRSSRSSRRSSRSRSSEINKFSSGDEGKYSSGTTGLDPDEYDIDVKSLARDAESVQPSARAEGMVRSALRDAEMDLLRDRQRARGGRSSRSPSARRNSRPPQSQGGRQRDLGASGRSSVDPDGSSFQDMLLLRMSAATRDGRAPQGAALSNSTRSGRRSGSRSGRRSRGSKRSRASAKRSRERRSRTSGGTNNNNNDPVRYMPGPLEASRRSDYRSMQTPPDGISEVSAATGTYPEVYVNDFSDSSMSEITTPGVVRGKASSSFASMSGTVPDEAPGRPNEAISSALEFVRRMKAPAAPPTSAATPDRGPPPADPLRHAPRPPLGLGADAGRGLRGGDNARMSQSDHAYTDERLAMGAAPPVAQSVFAPSDAERRESLFRKKSSVNMKRDQEFIMNELKCVIEDM